MPAFGLDIGTHSIKAVQLERTGDKFKLLGAGITSTPGKGMSGSAQDRQEVSQAIKKLVSETKLSTNNAHVALPEQQVFTRLISLPYLTDSEVASAIAWQAEPYVPIPLAQANLDYRVLERREPRDGKPGGVDVLLVAASKDLVKKYTDTISSAGLSVVSLETELLSLARCLAPEGKTVLICDMGASSTDLAIVKEQDLLVVRSVATAGDVLTRTAASGLGVSTAQAEEYKKSYGLKEDKLEGKVRLSLEPTMKVLVDEIRKLLQYYKNELLRKEAVGSVVLSGGTAGMPEIASYLASNLGMEVIIGDPFAKIVQDSRITESFRAWAPLYAISVGLAQKE